MERTFYHFYVPHILTLCPQAFHSPTLTHTHFAFISIDYAVVRIMNLFRITSNGMCDGMCALRMCSSARYIMNIAITCTRCTFSFLTKRCNLGRSIRNKILRLCEKATTNLLKITYRITISYFCIRALKIDIQMVND